MKKNKLKAKSNKSIIREINFDPEKGAAAAFAGSSVNGKPLKSLVRKGNKVILTYSN